MAELSHKNATNHSCFLLLDIHSSHGKPTKPHAHNRLGHARIFTAVQDQIRGFSYKLLAEASQNFQTQLSKEVPSPAAGLHSIGKASSYQGLSCSFR